MAKIDRWLSKEGLQQIESWAAACTDQELAGKLGVTRSTLALWKKTNSDISDAISRGRADVHACENVEKTLLDRALGYTATVKKGFKVRHVRYSDEGRRLSEDEEIVMVEEEQHIPADVGAIRFFLTNRAPGRWQNKVEMYLRMSRLPQSRFVRSSISCRSTIWRWLPAWNMRLPQQQQALTWLPVWTASQTAAVSSSCASPIRRSGNIWRAMLIPP